MPLRCLLFCPNGEDTELLVRVLKELQIDAETCPNAATATERVTSQKFQVVILDWDEQPDAGLLLNTARARKASERPLTLAIVGDDAGVPKALQAGANSIVRKPLLVNQVRDTIATARDLLRAKLEQSATTAKALAAKAPAGQPTISPASIPAVSDFEGSQEQTTLRAGEFLQSATPQPGAQFTTEADLEKRMARSLPAAEIDSLQELEPMAAALDSSDKVEAAPAPPPSQPRGLAWYKARNANLSAAAAAPAPAPSVASVSAPQPSSGQAELLSYEQTASHTPAPSQTLDISNADEIEQSVIGPPTRREQSDQKTESQLFAYMAGEKTDDPESDLDQSDYSPTRSGKWIAAVCAALVIAAGVYWWKLSPSVTKAGPQTFSTRATNAIHTWLNPQPVTPAQAPPAHENFAHAGDEYKLPVAEAIPDATTDPSQIQVVPIIDPTAKQPNTATTNSTQPSGTETQAVQSSSDQPPAAANASPSAAAPVALSSSVSMAPQPAQPPPSLPASAVNNSAEASTKPSVTPPPAPAPPRNPQPQYTAVSVGIPSSLKSQMASSTPEAGGNKPPEAAMPSIEPVSLPEAAARNLLQQQPAPVYPDSARGQSGTVVLQVLIGRDGAVQDAKFLQGSLAFARAAIDAVRQWHFQPYLMNGRPVSIVTLLTVNFKPTN